MVSVISSWSIRAAIKKHNSRYVETLDQRATKIDAQLDLMFYLLAKEPDTPMSKKIETVRNTAKIGPNTPEQESILSKLDQWDELLNPKNIHNNS